jgi:hypothetical protein
VSDQPIEGLTWTSTAERVCELEAENAKLRTAIQNAINTANGRWSEWGNRAESAFEFLFNAIEEEGPKS